MAKTTKRTAPDYGEAGMTRGEYDAIKQLLEALKVLRAELELRSAPTSPTLELVQGRDGR